MIPEKTERNAQIKIDYWGNFKSMRVIAKEHNISVARVQHIVHGMKQRYSKEYGVSYWITGKNIIWRKRDWLKLIKS